MNECAEAHGDESAQDDTAGGSQTSTPIYPQPSLLLLQDPVTLMNEVCPSDARSELRAVSHPSRKGPPSALWRQCMDHPEREVILVNHSRTGVEDLG